MKRKTVIIILILLKTTFAFSQNGFQIRGRVIDSETRLPLPGVVITLEGTLKGVVSNSAGRFRIEAPESKAVLKFRLLGYNDKVIELRADSAGKLLVKLDEKVNLLR